MLNYQRVLRLFTLQSSPRAEVRGKDAMDSLEEQMTNSLYWTSLYDLVGKFNGME